MRCWKVGVFIGLFILEGQVLLAQKITTSGTLAYDEIWSGRVHITGDVVVPEGLTLSVEAGTKITLASESDYDADLPFAADLGINKCNLIIKGNLKIQGTEDNEVIIGEKAYNLNTQSTISWGGIIFDRIGISMFPLTSILSPWGRGKGEGVSCRVNTNSIIEHCVIRYADIGITFAGHSTAIITQNTIAENSVGIMVLGAASPKIKSNRIHDNILWGISCYGYSSPIISDNIVEKNEVGIGSTDSSSPTIIHNTIANNKVGILIQGKSKSWSTNNKFIDNKEKIRIE